METEERKRLSIAQIETLYPEQFILIDEPEVDAENRIVSGIVAFADPEKTEVYRKASELKLTRTALHRTKKERGRKYVL
jgi:hypothetical protein